MLLRRMDLCLPFSADDAPTSPSDEDDDAARDKSLLRIESSLESGVSLTMKSSHA